MAGVIRVFTPAMSQSTQVGAVTIKSPVDYEEPVHLTNTARQGEKLPSSFYIIMQSIDPHIICRFQLMLESACTYSPQHKTLQLLYCELSRHLLPTAGP